MPIVSMLHSSSLSASAPQELLKPQDFPLHLPSALNYLDSPVDWDLHLMEYEWKLWWAQAHNALNKLRSHLCLCSHMYKFKHKNLWGQAASTRMQNLITRVEAKKDVAVEKYKRAC